MECDNGQNCRNHIINGTLASSLTLDCTGTTCDGSLILCPTSEGSSCIISCVGGPCAYSTILVEGNNNINSINLDCDSSYGCQYVDLQLNSKSINNVFIDCDATLSCYYMSLSLNASTSINNELYLACTNYHSCWYMDVDLNGNITDLSLYTGWDEPCRYWDFDITSTISRNFNVTCLSNGCKYLVMTIWSPFINSFLWSCRDTLRSCFVAFVALEDYVNINSWRIICDGYESCYYFYIWVRADNEYAKINSLDWSCSGTRACSGISVSGSQSVIGDFNLNCQECEKMGISLKISNSAVIQCKKKNACYLADVSFYSIASGVNYVLDCANFSLSNVSTDGACYNADFEFNGYFDVTQYQQDNNLTITCGPYDCNKAGFYGYNLDNVALECPLR